MNSQLTTPGKSAERGISTAGGALPTPGQGTMDQLIPRPLVQRGIITIGTGKGGSGKTTVTTNIAAALATYGYEVIIIDADSQPHSSSWGGRRADARSKANLHHDITTVVKFGKIGLDILDLSKKYDFVLIDVGGREGTELRQALAVSDLHILPMRPSDYDTWTISDLQDMIFNIERQADIRVDSRILINAAPSNPMMRDDLVFREEIIKTFDGVQIMNTTLRDRALYRRSVRPGKGVMDFAMSPAHQNDNAIQEIKDLFAEITGLEWRPKDPDSMNTWGNQAMAMDNMRRGEAIE